MSKIKTGGPAFPSKKRVLRAGYATNDYEPVDGMTLRDYFVAKIAEGDAAADKGWGGGVSDEQIAARVRIYFRIADAILAEREKGSAP